MYRDFGGIYRSGGKRVKGLTRFDENYFNVVNYFIGPQNLM